ncbi:MAG: 50S ribosomal protein L18 [Bacteroidetes bacterium HGW-Bacteroidetes-1]|nr:MAG: 50S ribosomal protein L18 [Bacteroidetes bacterium HGW-Bacteroidetes-1]
MKNKKDQRRVSIKKRIRKIVNGTAERPRLTVFRSNKQIYAQLIDDKNGKTIVAASSVEKGVEGTKVTKIEQAKLVGKLAAEKAIAAGIETVVFDRNGYLYHGRVKSLAEAAREGGLKF